VNITFTIFGKIKEEYLKDSYDEYIKRISKYCKVYLLTLPEVSCSSNSDILINKALDEEANKLLSILKEDSYLILIDLHGKEMDSIQFSKEIEKAKNMSSNIYICIGSSNGLSNILRKRANASICLSKLTTIHPLALLLTMEQVYRSFKILNNETYHK